MVSACEHSYAASVRTVETSFPGSRPRATWFAYLIWACALAFFLWPLPAHAERGWTTPSAVVDAHNHVITAAQDHQDPSLVAGDSWTLEAVPSDFAARVEQARGRRTNACSGRFVPLALGAIPRGVKYPLPVLLAEPRFLLPVAPQLRARCLLMVFLN